MWGVVTLGLSDVACPMESGPGIHLLRLFRDGGRGREVVVAAGHRSYGRQPKEAPPGLRMYQSLSQLSLGMSCCSRKGPVWEGKAQHHSWKCVHPLPKNSW